MQHTLVIGAGISGLAACQLLKHQQHNVVLYDDKPLEFAKLAQFTQLNIPLITAVGNWDHVAQIVFSPSVKLDHPLLETARARQIPVLSEIDLALKHFNGRLICVTGTNGKSTVCDMIGHLLKQLGTAVFVGGNLGTPPSLELLNSQIKDIWVLELSSYQLAQSQPIHAEVAIFTTFAKDHLSYHKTLEDYFKAKWRLITSRSDHGLALVHHAIAPLLTLWQLNTAQDQDIQWLSGESYDNILFVNNGGKVFKTQGDYVLELMHDKIHGRHNFLNMLFALLAVEKITKIPVQKLLPLLRSYQALPYRMEKIGTMNQHPVINDSKATNVEATIAALETLDTAILLLGGVKKEESFLPIAKYQKTVKQLILFGQDHDTIASELKPFFPTLKSFPKLSLALEHLVKKAANNYAPILFAPGCASFDEFNGFEERGAFVSQYLQQYLD